MGKYSDSFSPRTVQDFIDKPNILSLLGIYIGGFFYTVLALFMVQNIDSQRPLVSGTISQIFANKAKEVVGVEIVEEAVEKAIENAKINELDNLVFKANDVLKEIDSLAKKPDIVVVDPSRAGIHA